MLILANCTSTYLLYSNIVQSIAWSLNGWVYNTSKILFYCSTANRTFFYNKRPKHFSWLFTTWQEKRKGETKRAAPVLTHHKMLMLILLKKESIVYVIACGYIDLSGRTREMRRNGLVSGAIIIIREKRTIQYTILLINWLSKKNQSDLK